LALLAFGSPSTSSGTAVLFVWCSDFGASRQNPSTEKAIEWSKRFREIVGDGESEIVQLFGPDDFGAA
jgi:hypothetical protein